MHLQQECHPVYLTRILSVLMTSQSWVIFFFLLLLHVVNNFYKTMSNLEREDRSTFLQDQLEIFAICSVLSHIFKCVYIQHYIFVGRSEVNNFVVWQTGFSINDSEPILGCQGIRGLLLLLRKRLHLNFHGSEDFTALAGVITTMQEMGTPISGTFYAQTVLKFQRPGQPKKSIFFS